MAGSGQGVQSQDIIKVSATSGLTPAPQARDHKVEVAKLIDVSTCIGCKACQVGCSEWNDIRSDVNAQCVSKRSSGLPPRPASLYSDNIHLPISFHCPVAWVGSIARFIHHLLRL